MRRGRCSITMIQPSSSSSRTHSDLLQQVFRTEYDVVIMQGEAILVSKAAAAGLLSPATKCSISSLAYLANGLEDFIHRYGGETIELAVPYNDAIDPEDVRKALQANPGSSFPFRRALRNAVRNAKPCSRDRRRWRTNLVC